MQYTVTSRGRPIGVTDLGFRSRPDASRMGWFHPNAEGEKLMPIVAAVTAATRAYALRPRRGRDTRSVESEDRDATLLADVTEAYQRAGALDLGLQAEDGTLIPTEFVCITDTDELLAWPDFEEAIELGEAWKYGDQLPDPLYDPSEDLFDEELDGLGGTPEPPSNAEQDAELIFADGFADTAGPWTPDEFESDPLMRYQIVVSLIDPAAIP